MVLESDDPALASAAALRAALARRPSLLAETDATARTPLIVAATAGDRDMVEAALELGADVNAEDVGGRTAFLWAAAEGQVAVLALLLEVDETQLDSCTSAGNSPLHRAAAYGQAAALELLLSHGGGRSAEAVDSLNEEGATPLLRACRWGHADCARLLVRAGADPQLADAAGVTPRQWAERKGFGDVLEALAPQPGDATTGAGAAAGGFGSGQGQGDEAGGETEGQADAYMEGDEAAEGEGENEAEAEVEAEAGAEGDGAVFGQPMKVEGWMAKQGHFIRNWKNRWFMLEYRNIYYFNKEGAAKPKGCIHMVAGTDIIIEERYNKPFCFTLVTPKKKFILQAGNEDEMRDWVEAIQNNLESCVDEGDEGEDDGGDD